jgi:hypothetical protein
MLNPKMITLINFQFKLSESNKRQKMLFKTNLLICAVFASGAFFCFENASLVTLKMRTMRFGRIEGYPKKNVTQTGLSGYFKNGCHYVI